MRHPGWRKNLALCFAFASDSNPPSPRPSNTSTKTRNTPSKSQLKGVSGVVFICGRCPVFWNKRPSHLLPCFSPVGDQLQAQKKVFAFLCFVLSSFSSLPLKQSFLSTVQLASIMNNLPPTQALCKKKRKKEKQSGWSFFTSHRPVKPSTCFFLFSFPHKQKMGLKA